MTGGKGTPRKITLRENKNRNKRSLKEEIHEALKLKEHLEEEGEVVLDIEEENNKTTMPEKEKRKQNEGSEGTPSESIDEEMGRQPQLNKTDEKNEDKQKENEAKQQENKKKKENSICRGRNKEVKCKGVPATPGVIMDVKG